MVIANAKEPQIGMVIAIAVAKEPQIGMVIAVGMIPLIDVTSLALILINWITHNYADNTVIVIWRIQKIMSVPHGPVTLGCFFLDWTFISVKGGITVPQVR